MSQKNIHWFPGHMQKALRLIKERLKLVDIVLELCDARAPRSSLNEVLRDITKHKKRIIVLTKNDLADQNITNKWVEYLSDKQVSTLFGNLNDNRFINEIKAEIARVWSQNEAKTLPDGHKILPPNVLVVGIPNVGKSTLINKLSGRKAASVANRPGHTKNQQYINVDRSFILIDTPGILPPNYENKNYIHNLALLGTIREEILPIETLSVDLATFLLDKYYPLLQTRYDLKEKINNPHELFISIAKRRGILGDELEVVNRTQSLLLTEFRNGLIGPISLETPHEK
ncbi:MAG: ribosome biogenesis GTPase YlqF [Erysipelotrichaceae bacterium]|jgi:ribosome biogenesis GTPase A|nr:ribosome biogenesis GTPase YlqF [Bacillota bacterium]MDY0118825.1 ribosome biogenesis GTPase YlqF [Bacilli bacterium]NLJ32504.1 ribosome biogenesis GTPase YlqF [Erysipelotrichaceae bacterium]